MVSDSRENTQHDRVHGIAAPDGSDARPRKVLTPDQKATWGLEGLSELQIIELGDRHPGQSITPFPSSVDGVRIVFGHSSLRSSQGSAMSCDPFLIFSGNDDI